MASLAAGLNWTKDRASSGITALAASISSTPTMASLSAMVPVSSAEQSTFSDPSSLVAGQIAGKVTAAENSLCSGNWGSALASTLTYACGQINNPSVSIGGLYGVIDAFPGVQTAATNATTELTSICSTMNGIGTKTLTISNPTGIGPADLYNARLFPSYTTPSGC